MVTQKKQVSWWIMKWGTWGLLIGVHKEVLSGLWTISTNQIIIYRFPLELLSFQRKNVQFYIEVMNIQQQIFLISQKFLQILIYFIVILEKGLGIHQRSFGVGDEIRQILPRIQANLEDSSPRKGQADHHCQQHSSLEVQFRDLLRSSAPT